MSLCQLNNRLNQFIKLLTSEWFLPNVLEYLEVSDIVKLDSVTSKWKKCSDKTIGSLSTRVQKYLTSDESIHWCSKHNITFKTLNLNIANENKPTFTLEGASLLARQCVDLKELVMSRGESSLHKLGNQQHIFKTFLTELLKYCNNLEILKLSGDIPLTDEDLYAIGNNCQILKELNLNISGLQFTQNGMIYLLQNCTNLRTLKCPRGSKFSYLLLLGQYLKCIENVDIQWSEDDDEIIFEQFTKSCLCLKSLRTCGYLHKQSSLQSSLTSSLSLSQSSLSQSSQSSQSEQSADIYLQHLGTNCQLLETIFMIFEIKFSLQGLAYVAHGCPKLKSVKIVGDCAFGVEVVKLFGEHCPLLETMYFDLQYMNDDILIELGRCNHLKTVHFYQANSITDAGVRALVATNRNLQNITFSDCELLTDNNLIAIADNCPHLKTLFYQNKNTDMNSDALKYVYKKCTKLINKKAALLDCR